MEIYSRPGFTASPFITILFSDKNRLAQFVISKRTSQRELLCEDGLLEGVMCDSQE